MAGACMHRWTHTQQQQGPARPDGHTHTHNNQGRTDQMDTHTTRAGWTRWTHTQQQGPDGPDGPTHNNKGRMGQMDPHTHNNKGRMDQTDTHTVRGPDGHTHITRTRSDPAGTGRLGKMAGACMQKPPVDHTHRSASPLGLPAGLHACNALAPSAHCLAPVFGRTQSLTTSVRKPECMPRSRPCQGHRHTHRHTHTLKTHLPTSRHLSVAVTAHISSAL